MTTFCFFGENLECWIPEIGTVWTDEALAPVFSCTQKTVKTCLVQFSMLRVYLSEHCLPKNALHPGKLTFWTETWRFGSDDFPFQIGCFSSFQPHIFPRVFCPINHSPPPFDTRPGDKNLWRSWNRLVLLLWHLVRRGHTCFEQLEGWLKALKTLA